MIGLVSSPQPFQMKHTLIAGAYEPDAKHGVSIILQTFDFLNLTVAIDGERMARLDQITHFRQTLDMKRAAFTTILIGTRRLSATPSAR